MTTFIFGLGEECRVGKVFEKEMSFCAEQCFFFDYSLICLLFNVVIHFLQKTQFDTVLNSNF